jgi:hypothetical protein
MGYFLDKAKSTILDRDSEIIPPGIGCAKSAKSVKSPPPVDTSTPARNYYLKYPDAPADDQELTEIENRVVTKGYVLLWSNTLNDFVAFYKTEADRGKIPPGFVPYSDKELSELFGKNLSPRKHTLRLIHEAKKLGGCVVDDESG